MIPLAAWLLWLSCACVAAHYAKQRGRNPYIWFFIGFVFSLPGLLVLFILPRKKPKKEEVMVKEAEEAAPAPKNILIPPEGSHPFWYYLDQGNQQCGPMSFNALEKAWNEGKVTLNTYVWNEAMENWKLFGEIIPS